ncbi:hypothetical protein H2200_002990 [Cladophialophora chaetospira]|uniref:Myb-like DNA-binding domain-containing protein n=1 Tax=Cladophialophora chaetospira TaxID=386627 RepID=A0AA38XGK8_9EURO|nr:hypothetical protein H2200_002990 [Cladophialophora chaetospira]
MAPWQPDDNVIFLYNCILHATGPGKFNWDGVAAATGSSKGACAMRYKRLVDKIEANTGVGAAHTATGTSATTQSNAAKDKKKSTTPRKRKATDVKDKDTDDNAPMPPQVDGASDLPPRRTRGKRVNYGVVAGYPGGTLTTDDELSLTSFDDSDDDFVFKPTTVKSEDEDDSLFGAEIGDKPDVKRFKKSQSSSMSDRTTLTPVAAAKTRDVAPVTPPSSVRKHGNDITQKTTSPKNATEFSSKIPVSSKPKVKSTMHPSQQPLPSIEFSPPSTPTHAKKKQSVTASESDFDIDIKSLRPGTVLEFPVKRQSRVSSVSSTTPKRFSTPITIASSVSSSHDSAGKALKQNLADHAEQNEIRPEDSVSNIGVRAEEEFVIAPSTPTGKHPHLYFVRLRMKADIFPPSRSRYQHSPLLEGFLDFPGLVILFVRPEIFLRVQQVLDTIAARRSVACLGNKTRGLNIGWKAPVSQLISTILASSEQNETVQGQNRLLGALKFENYEIHNTIMGAHFADAKGEPSRAHEVFIEIEKVMSMETYQNAAVICHASNEK